MKFPIPLIAIVCFVIAYSSPFSEPKAESNLPEIVATNLTQLDSSPAEFPFVRPISITTEDGACGNCEKRLDDLEARIATLEATCKSCKCNQPVQSKPPVAAPVAVPSPVQSTITFPVPMQSQCYTDANGNRVCPNSAPVVQSYRYSERTPVLRWRR